MWAAGLSAMLVLTSLSQDSIPVISDLDRLNRDKEKPSLIHHLTLSTGYFYVASSVGDELREVDPEDKISVHSAVPVHLKYSFSFTDPEVRHYLPGGYQGVAVGLFNPGAAEAGGWHKASRYIGNPVMVYAFQGGPFYRFGQGLSLNYEWNFGASFGWKPYSEDNRFFNLTVGSRVNAYINLAFTLGWQINEHTSIFGGFTATHFSNGNTSWPNPGVNALGLKLGATWTINPLKEGYEPAIADTIRRRVEFDVMGWGTARKRVYKGGETPVLLKGRYACAGLSFAPMYRFNTWWRLGGSLDFQWDESSDLKRNHVSGENSDDIKFTRPDFFRQVTVGVSVHGELQMPIFAVNVGCGYNFVAPWENRGTYQNIALKTYIGPKFFINIGYQLRNFIQQSSLMLGAGVTI